MKEHTTLYNSDVKSILTNILQALQTIPLQQLRLLNVSLTSVKISLPDTSGGLAGRISAINLEYEKLLNNLATLSSKIRLLMVEVSE